MTHSIRSGVLGSVAASVALVTLSGCAASKSQAGKQGGDEPSPTLILHSTAKEPGPAPKPETLEAVEEFLARTQEYRFPSKTDGGVAPPAAMSAVKSAESVLPSPAAPAAIPDAAYANAQLSVSATPPSNPPQSIPAIESVSVRAAPNRIPTSETASKPGMTNGPLEVQMNRAQDAANSLAGLLQEELKGKKDPATEWKLRMFLLSQDRASEEASLPEHGAEKLKGVLPALGVLANAVREAVRNPDQGSARALQEAEALRGKLAVLAGPRVMQVELCRKVTTFGAYEEMPEEDFVSGRSLQTIVYAEIENLRAVPLDENSFETRLSTRLEVLTTEGKSMWLREEPEVTDRCRRARRDFFVAQRITLPPTLPEGEYVLKVSIEDKGSESVCEGSAKFRMQSPVSVAKGQ